MYISACVYSYGRTFPRQKKIGREQIAANLSTHPAVHSTFDLGSANSYMMVVFYDGVRDVLRQNMMVFVSWCFYFMFYRSYIGDYGQEGKQGKSQKRSSGKKIKRKGKGLGLWEMSIHYKFSSSVVRSL